MAIILRHATAVDVLIGPFVDITDGATAETGESPSVKLSKEGQTLAAKNDATTPTHDADGYYNCELDATDTNTVGGLTLTVAASASALPVRHEFYVVEESVYDSMFESGALGPLSPSVAGRTLNVTAAGQGAIDWNDIGTPTATVNFTNTTIGTTTTNTDMITSVEIADAVWNEATADHTTSGTFGQALYTFDEGTAAAATSTTLTLEAGS
jgi:hypothetical protein